MISNKATLWLYIQTSSIHPFPVMATLTFKQHTRA